jgi:hypothetical protein
MNTIIKEYNVAMRMKVLFNNKSPDFVIAMFTVEMCNVKNKSKVAFRVINSSGFDVTVKFPPRTHFKSWGYVILEIIAEIIKPLNVVDLTFFNIMQITGKRGEELQGNRIPYVNKFPVTKSLKESSA